MNNFFRPLIWWLGWTLMWGLLFIQNIFKDFQLMLIGLSIFIFIEILFTLGEK